MIPLITFCVFLGILVFFVLAGLELQIPIALMFAIALGGLVFFIVCNCCEIEVFESQNSQIKELQEEFNAKLHCVQYGHDWRFDSVYPRKWKFTCKRCDGERLEGSLTQEDTEICLNHVGLGDLK